MKKIILLFLFFSSIVFSQTKGISYQALIIDPVTQELPGVNNNNAPLANKNICLKFSFIDELDALEYEEIFTITTDNFGMVNLIIGTELKTGGYATSFEDIQWSLLPKNLKIDLSVDASCSNFIEISNAPFTAVPFALFAVNTVDNPLILENQREIALLKVLIRATQIGAGLDADGGYTPEATTFFINSVTSLKEADIVLDNQIKTNENNINANSGFITTNTSNITTNSVNINKNTTAIATNVTDIAGNTTNITTNTTDIASNDTDIAANTLKVGYTEALVSANTDVVANTAKVTNATHTGDVTGSAALTIANDVITTDKILDANVTDAKIAAVSASKLTGVVGIAAGGTNITTFTQGDILYATSAGVLTKLPKGTAGQVLTMNTGATAPEWVNSETTTYSIGDFAHGGIVFWVDETGKHGLVCAKQDRLSTSRWWAGTRGKTRARGDGVYSGKANTAIIIAVQTGPWDDGLSDGNNLYINAARYCNELQIVEGDKTFGDWYLPSKYELNLMYQNKTTINTTASANGGSNFHQYHPNYYWSSTESNSMPIAGAWAQHLTTGHQVNTDKPGAANVRAVRAF